MKVFVDTNVLVDFVCNRDTFAANAKKLFAHGYLGEYTLQTSALSFITAMYVGERFNHPEVRTYLERVSSFIEVLDLYGKDVVDMLSSGWKDYEDSVQHQSAVHFGSDCILTRNKKDFKNSVLPVYTPEELIEILKI